MEKSKTSSRDSVFSSAARHAVEPGVADHKRVDVKAAGIAGVTPGARVAVGEDERVDVGAVDGVAAAGGDFLEDESDRDRRDLATVPGIGARQVGDLSSRQDHTAAQAERIIRECTEGARIAREGQGSCTAAAGEAVQQDGPHPKSV